MPMSPAFDATEGIVIQAVQWLKLLIETIGAVTVGIGMLLAVWQFARTAVLAQPTDYNAIRLTLARYLALALEFQLGADILSTAIAPGWQEIGKLGAIAVIRTGLNYFLSKEMDEERAAETLVPHPHGRPPAPPGRPV